MLEFRIGERVTFHPEGRSAMTGVITRYNKKTVSLVTDSGQLWNVAPQLLERAAPDARVTSPVGGKVIPLPRPDSRRSLRAVELDSTIDLACVHCRYGPVTRRLP